MARAPQPDDTEDAPDHPGRRLRAYANDEFEHAASALKLRKFEDGEGVHDARKTLRHVRALFRLGNKTFRHAAKPIDENLRELARSLSALRDAHVMLATLEFIFENDPSPFDEDLRGKARTALRHRRRVLLEKILHSDPHLHRLRDAFKAAHKDVDALPWKHVRVRNIERALLKSCDRINAAGNVAADPHDGEARHAWRRRIRRLRHQLRAIEAIGMKAPGISAKKLSAHADELGREQDLRVLRRTLAHLAALSGEERARLDRAIGRAIDRVAGVA